MRMRLTTCLLVIFLALPVRLAAQESSVTTVVLVRHAEKEAEPAADPPLTAEGKARAEVLADMLTDAGVSAVFTTQWERTRATGQVVAERVGAELIVTPSGGAYPTAVAERILADYAGTTVLVVSHSNRIGAIIEALGGPTIEEIPESEYEKVFVLMVGPGNAVRLVRAFYPEIAAK